MGNKANQQTLVGSEAAGQQENPGARPGERTLREERILDAAAGLLARWGYRKTTIDDVAREAGVGKGTIYLHWKDKNELFCAVLWRASQQVGESVMQRVAADPEGGLLHRQWTHSMLAAFSHPLIAAFTKEPDILQGLLSSFDKKLIAQLMGQADTYVAQVQSAGLIRADLPVPIISYLMTVLKVGFITAPDLIGRENQPSLEQLTEALSDLLRRWLEPEQLPSDTSAGKGFLGELLEKVKGIEEPLE